MVYVSGTLSGSTSVSFGVGVAVCGNLPYTTITNPQQSGTAVNTGTFTSASGVYTKVGRAVTVILDCIIGTGGGTQISGLPFASGNTIGFTPYIAGQTYDAGYTHPSFVIGGTGSAFLCRENGSGQPLATLSLSAGATIHLTVTYFV